MRSTLLAALALGAVGLNAGCHSVPSTPIDELATEAPSAKIVART